MKKSIKLIASSVFILVLVFSMTVTSFAGSSSVTYKGQAEKFIFSPGSEYSPTDLFTSFKDVMPGDTLTQQIEVKNDASKEVKVKIYMRALGPAALQNKDGEEIVSEADSADFLKEMNLTVKLDGESVLFDAPADQTAGLTDWVCLGTFYSGADVLLNVGLNVPVTMDNDYQQRIGALDWQFKVEEFPVEKDDPIADNPDDVYDSTTKTGDDMNIIIPAVILVAALAAIAAIFVSKRRKEGR